MFYLINITFKGIVHPKMKMLSSLTYPHVVPNLHEFLFSKEDILKNVGNKTVFVFLLWTSMSTINIWLSTFFTLSLCVCVQQKK